VSAQQEGETQGARLKGHGTCRFKASASASPDKSRRGSTSETSRKRSQPAAVTIRDVAERSGFSFRHGFHCSEQRAARALHSRRPPKERIQRAAAQLGYRPNLFARSLRGRRSHTVGVHGFRHDRSVLHAGAARQSRTLSIRSSFLPILTDVHNERSRFERYLEMLLDRRIEGLVVLANWLFVDIDLLADLEKHNIPTAVVGRELKNDTSAR